MTSVAASLPRSRAVLYASGSAGSQVMLQTLTVWLVYFYVSAGDYALAPILLVGVATTIGRLTDAFTDPLIGYWSDVTRSRWGRRAPFIVLGAPFMALAFMLVWTPPVDGTSWLNGAWLAVVLQVYFLFVTVVGAPYTGIYPELATTERDRVLVSAWQHVFGLLGAGFALLATGPMIEQFGYAGTGVVVAVIGVVPRYIGLWGARGRLSYVPDAVPSAAEFRRTAVYAFRLTFTNRNFLYLMGSLLCFHAALLMLTQGVPFFVVELLGMSEGRVVLVTASFFVSGLIAIPVVVWATRRWDKVRVYAACLVAGSLLLPFIGVVGLLPEVSPLLQAVIILGLVGFPMSGIFILPDALLADVVDEDADRTHFRREAMYFSSRATLEKFGQAAASGLFALLIGAFGATADDPLGIRLVGPVAAGCTALGWWLLVRGYRSPVRGAATGGDR
jgi:glycoside/pentoside/hexuronide:cation symporter, GPH family